MNTWVFERDGDLVRSFLLDENNHALEIHEDSLRQKIRIGDIYVGRVSRVLCDLEAAFVDIGPGEAGYLPLKELPPGGETLRKYGEVPAGDSVSAGRPLKNGDELPVQVTREGSAMKKMALTGKLSLKSPYCMVTYGGNAGVSKKIGGEERRRFRQMAEELSTENCGVLIRTEASQISGEKLRDEILAKRKELETMVASSRTRTAFTCLSRKPWPFLERMENGGGRDIGRITTADPELCQILEEYLSSHHPGLSERFSFYDEEKRTISLRSCYCLGRELERARNRIVNLPSGAFLVIERTEALNVIDVNTGRNASSKKHRTGEENFLQTNLEAAGESARQIRLRNLSGIILIDFINMKEEKDIRLLTDTLREFLREDPVRTELVDRTKLGLFEITRRKIERPLE